MSGSSRHDEVQTMLPELALGVATGEDRAGAMAHLPTCPRCRRDLERLSDVADEVMLLAPSREPPAGFESAVLDRLRGPAAAPHPPRRRRILAAAAAVLSVVLSAALVWLAGGDEREDAEHYRRALAAADGSYFGARPLEDAAGRPAGNVFGYSGTPSWVVVVLREGVEDERYAVRAVTRAGRALDLGSFGAAAPRAVFAATLDVRLGDLERLRLVPAGPAPPLEAVFPPPDG